MARHAFFYNSENGDRVYDADSFSDWLKKFFTTGVFQGDLQVVADSGMNVKAGTGYTNIEGKVKIFDAETILTIENANPTYDRIDTIVAERNDTDRDITIKVVTGSFSTDPRPVPPVREAGIYQLVLAEVYVAAGSTAITQENITDKRMDETVCGMVYTPMDKFDFNQFAIQFYAWEREQQIAFAEWFATIRDILDKDVAGHLQNEIDALKEKIEQLQLVHLIVNHSDDLNGRIIKAQNGPEIHEVIADSSGTTIINGMSLGTWIISVEYEGKTISASVDTRYYGNYYAELETAITLNLTVYSAASDTVNIYYGGVKAGSPDAVCATNTSGVGSVTVTVPKNANVLFESTKAKDTTSGTTNYQKNVTLSDSTSEIKLMPDGKIICWYGNIVEPLNENFTLETGWVKDSRSWSYGTNSLNSPSIPTPSAANTFYYRTIGTANKISLAGYNTARFIFKKSNDDTILNKSYDISSRTEDAYVSTSIMRNSYNATGYYNNLSTSNSNVRGTKVFEDNDVVASSNWTLSHYAIWLE